MSWSQSPAGTRLERDLHVPMFAVLATVVSSLVPQAAATGASAPAAAATTSAANPLSALDVPFVPQKKDTCGAATLAMVLGYYGVEVSHDVVAGALVDPELHGILGSRLADFAREKGMVAIVFAGDLENLRAHLAKGRPLIVAISSGRDRYHDVVVTGWDESRRELIVNDPAAGPRRRIAESELDRRWRETGRWTLLVQPAASESPSQPAESGARAEAQQPRTAERPAPPASTVGPRGSVAPVSGGYDALVAEAIALGRGGRHVEAERLLERAIALEQARPEAFVERGGLRFLDGEYDSAARDLRRALALRDDPYARDLLASSLHLAGRSLEALAVWNRLGRPTLRGVEIGGLERTRDEVARREIGLSAGDVVTPASLRAARRRLEETTAFERITLRPLPRGDGTADLEAALSERHGLARGPLDLLVSTGVNLAWQRVRLRYSNLGGGGISLAGAYRWQENRPETSLQLQWPRPFGLPVYARLSGFRGEQAYSLGSPFAVRRRGVDLGLRHVLGDGTTVSLDLRASDRSYSRRRTDGKAGLVVGAGAAIETRLVETARQRLDASARLFGGRGGSGSDLAFAQAEGELRYEAIVSAPDGRSVERSALALRLRGGWGSARLPVDWMYAPGVSPDSDLLLRAHPQTTHGVIGANPVGRRLVLANAEWRQRLWHRPTFDVGVVGFGDAAGVWQAAVGGSSGMLVDVGVGLRVSFLAGPTVRVDHAWGLRDRRHALFIGLGQAF